MENQNYDQNTQQVQPQSAAGVTTQQQPQTQIQRRYVRPRASITENGDGFVVTVEMPGVNRTGLEVTFENGELTLVGHRTPFQTKAELVYRESRPMDFRRVFELDASIDAGNIGAQLDQGLLTLTPAEIGRRAAAPDRSWRPELNPCFLAGFRPTNRDPVRGFFLGQIVRENARFCYLFPLTQNDPKSWQKRPSKKNPQTC